MGGNLSDQSTKPQTFRQGLFLAVFTALLAGIFALAATLIQESGQDRRLLTEFDLLATKEARVTEAVEILAPGSPAAPPTPALPPTVTPAPTSEDQVPSPEQAIIAYYDALNNGEYLEAWSRLSDNFQFRFNDNDFESNKAFWQGAGPVSVVEVILEDQPNQFQTTLLSSIYWDTDRRIRSNRYSMVLDLERDIWLIDEVSAVD